MISKKNNKQKINYRKKQTSSWQKKDIIPWTKTINPKKNIVVKGDKGPQPINRRPEANGWQQDL